MDIDLKQLKELMRSLKQFDISELERVQFVMKGGVVHLNALS